MGVYIGVRFKQVGKLHYFRSAEGVAAGTQVIVETSRGIECGVVAIETETLPENLQADEIKDIIRVASEKDQKVLVLNRKKEEEAIKVCNERVAFHKLDMKLVDVECTFDNNKLLFYFTAENRVDFRELVKDLAAVFRTRIELRQIGVRDEAKLLGGLGICGRPFCCGTFLEEFQPVSIKMAKEQGLSLNPTKISGTCGRLMCCLKYEQDVYEQLVREMPKEGSLVETPEGRGVVTEVSLLAGKLKVKLDKVQQEGIPPSSFGVADVKFIRGEQRQPKNEVRSENAEKEKSE